MQDRTKKQRLNKKTPSGAFLLCTIDFDFSFVICIKTKEKSNGVQETRTNPL